MEILNQIVSQFNSREYAILTWIWVFFLFAFTKKDIRKGAFDLFFSAFLLQMLFIITSYNFLITFILFKLWFWNIEYFKESLYWFFGSSLVFFFNLKQVDQGKIFFKKTLLQMLWFTAILGFLGNFYTFSFLFEIFLQPFLFISVLMLSFAEAYKDKEPKYKITIKFLNYIIWFIVIIFLVKSFIEIWENFSSFFQQETFVNFFYPIFYMGLFYPFLYLFRLLMQYESLFVRVKIRDSNKKLDYFYVKLKMFLLCWFNLVRLNQFSTWRMFWMEEKYEIDKIIADFKNKN